MFLNKVQLIGNLTRDPELRALPNGGQQVCAFSIATNETYKKDGQKIEKTEFHNIVAWGRTAEIVAQYCKKGSSIYVEGKLQTRKYEKEGQTHYRTEITALNIQLGSRPRNEGGNNEHPLASEFDQSNSQASGAEVAAPEDDINPEDIPF